MKPTAIALNPITWITGYLAFAAIGVTAALPWVITYLFFAAIAIAILYTVRNIIAIPISLILRLFKVANPYDKATHTVGSVGSLIWALFIGALFICWIMIMIVVCVWIAPVFSIAFKDFWGNLMTIFSLIPELIKLAF